MSKRSIKVLFLTMIMVMNLLPFSVAKAEQNELIYETRTFIDEQFDNYEEALYNLTTDYVQMPQNGKFSYKKYKTWSKPCVGISANGKTGKAFYIDLKDGGAIRIDNPEGTTQLESGDIIHINFDTAYSAEKANMNLYINDGKKLRFRQVDRAALQYSPYAPTYKDSSQLLNLNYTNKTISTTGSIPYENCFDFQPNTWVNVDVVIDTQDEYFNGEQSIKVTLGNGVWWYGTLDADYTGNDETVVDAFTSFTSLNLDTAGGYAGEENIIKLDNVKVEITQQVIETDEPEDIKEIVEVKESIVSENFENAYVLTPSTKGYDKKIQGIDNTITYSTSSWSEVSQLKISIDEDSAKGNVFSNEFSTAGYHVSTLKIKNQEKSPINVGEELHISFDAMSTALSGSLAVKLNDTEKLAFTAKSYPGSGAWMKSVAGTGELLKIKGNKVMPCGTDYYSDGWSNGHGVTETGKWYNYKIIIKTKDKSYNNDQTITIIMDDGENQTKFCGLLDKTFNGVADANGGIKNKDTIIDKIIDFSELQIVVAQDVEDKGGVAVDYNIDNVNVDIVKPGFWVYGDAVSGFGVRPNGFETQKKVIIECAADVNYLKNTDRMANFIIAQYKNERLEKVEVHPVEITADNYTFAYSTKVNDSIDTIRAFLFGENIEPIIGKFDLSNLELDNEIGETASGALYYDFENLENNIEPEGVSYINFNSAADDVFTYGAVSGVFGKNTNDTALCISNSSNAFDVNSFTGENANIRYQAASFKTGRFDLSDDESVVLEFEFANESKNAVKTIKSTGYINGDSIGVMDNILEVDKDGFVRILGHRVEIDGTKVNVANNKWYNVRLVLKPANDFTGTINRVTAYWDGMLVIDNLPFTVGGKTENSFEGFSDLEIGYDIKNSVLDNSSLLEDGSAAQYKADAIYLDSLSCIVVKDSEIEETNLSLMSGSAYYANTIDMQNGVIYNYGQSPILYAEKLKADDLKTALFVDENGLEISENISNGYLRLTDSFDRTIFYKVEEGTDEVMQSISDIDAENEGNPDLSGYYVYEQPDINKLKGSALDASFVLDAPAGKYGFVRREGESFVFDNGNEIQFWGINIGGQGAFPESKKEAEAIADRVATAGFNLVRIHNIDGGERPNVFGYNKSGKVLDEVQMDKLCYLLSELKERGIYYYIDQTGYRPVFEDDDLDSTDGIDKGLKGPTYFNRKIIDIQKNYSEMLLGYKNPYTGLTLAEDPAMAMIGLNNEFTLSDKIDKLGDYYYNELCGLFNEWLVEKYSNRSSLATAWWQWGKDGILSDEDPTKGTVKLRCYNSTEYSKKRSNDEMEFIGSVMNNYFNERISHLRALGVKCAITGNTAVAGSEVPCFYSNTYTDFIDFHNYWSHPQGGEALLNAAGTRFNAYNINQSVLENKSTDTMGIMGAIGRTASRQIYGYPYVISEWMFCPGNPYMSEGMLLTAAYGRMQGWHPILFALNEKNDYFSRVEDEYEFVQKDSFSTIANPVYAAAYPASAIMYLRKDVAESEKGYYNTYSDNEVYIGTNHDSIWWGSYPLKNMNQYALIGKTGSVFIGRTDTPQNDETIKSNVESANSTNVYVSNTNELTTDLNNQVFTMNTDKSKAVSGFIEGEEINLDGVVAKINNKHATVMVTSLDGLSIQSSKRILLTLLGNSRNYGQIFSEDTNTVIKGGQYPIITEQITGSFSFELVGNYKVYALSSSGERKYEIPITITETGFSFDVTKDLETMNIEIVSEN